LSPDPKGNTTPSVPEKQYQLTTGARERDYWPRRAARLDNLCHSKMMYTQSLPVYGMDFHAVIQSETPRVIISRAELSALTM